MDFSVNRGEEKYEIIKALRSMPDNCDCEDCKSILKKAKEIFTKDELELICKELNITMQ